MGERERQRERERLWNNHLCCCVLINPSHPLRTCLIYLDEANEALHHWHKALQIAEEIEDTPNQIDLVNKLGALFEQHGEDPANAASANSEKMKSFLTLCLWSCF